MYMPFHRMKCTYTQFSLGLHFSTYTFDKFNHEIFWNISPAISKWKTLSFKIHKGATFDAHLSGKQHYWEFFLSNLPVRCPETDTGICSIVFSEPGRENIIKAFPFGGRLFLVLKISFIRWKHKNFAFGTALQYFREENLPVLAYLWHPEPLRQWRPWLCRRQHGPPDGAGLLQEG